MPKRNRKQFEGAQRRDVSDKLVIFYAEWYEDYDQKKHEVVAMGRSEAEFTDNLTMWMLGVTEDQQEFERIMKLPPSGRWPAIKEFVEKSSEGELSRDAYTLGADRGT